MSMNGGDASITITTACERKLVHWVNSLPLPQCLLVEDLTELCFGVALWTIVAWIRNDLKEPILSDDTNPDIRARVAEVVQFTAQQCCTQDRDLMYIVNGAQCVARVMAGDVATIAAVVQVLKRLVEQLAGVAHAKREARRDTSRSIVDRSLRVRQRRVISAATENENDHERQDHQHEPVVYSPLRSLARNTALPPKANPISRRASITATTTSLSVVRIQPQGKKPATDENANRSNFDSAPPRAIFFQPASQIQSNTRDLLDWMAKLGVTIACEPSATSRSTGGRNKRGYKHPDSAASLSSVLEDGVLLCQLAAAITQRRGSSLIQHKLQATNYPLGDSTHRKMMWYPRGATLAPRTRAEKRHNLSTAWNLLRECRVLPPPPSSMDFESFCGLLTSTSEEPIWSLLLDIKNAFTRRSAPSRANCPDTATAAGSALLMSGDTNTMLSPLPQQKRPYITSEQIDVTKKWMKSIGVDPNVVSSGILEDTLRTGVALCQVVGQLTARQKSPKIVIKNPPKTLIEVKANISKALHVLIALDGSSRCTVPLQMPRVYLTPHAVEGIAMGDKQYIYGILWHLMQFQKDQDAMKSQATAGLSKLRPSSASTKKVHEPAELPPPPQQEKEVKEEMKTEQATPRLDPPVVQAQPATMRHHVTAFELDIPACELADEEAIKVGDLSGLSPSPSSCGMAPWDETEMDEDIVPSTVCPPHTITVNLPRTTDTSGTMSVDDEDDIVPRRDDDEAFTGEDELCQVIPRTTTAIAKQRQEIMVQNDSDDAPLSGPTQKAFDEPATPIETARDPLPLDAPLPSFSETQVNQVLAWLRQLGIDVASPSDFHDPRATLVEFQSGVLLCSIVEKLEHMRSIEGICRHKKIAKANALHNIDKAFEILQRKKAMPLNLLRRKAKVHAGDRATILSLLIGMRKAYGHHLRRPLGSPVAITSTNLMSRQPTPSD